MVPKEFRKSLCVAAALITLIEAIIYGISSIYIIQVNNCNWDFFNIEKGVSVWSMLYVTYFMGGCQGGIGALVLGYFFEPPTASAKNFQIWMWIYAVLSILWIPACILFIVAALSEVRGKQGAVLYYPWTGLAGAISLLDLAGAVYHMVDIFNTLKPEDYAQFTAAESWKILTLDSSTDGVVTWLPSLFVTLFFCRFLVFWILNIYFIYQVNKASTAISQYPTKFKEQVSRVANQFGQEHNLKYETDEFGIVTNERNRLSLLEDPYTKNEPPRSPYQNPRHGSHHSSHPGRLDSYGDSVPTVASGVKYPPQLNKFEPFSYIAGDQPQMIRRPVSRSNSRSEHPSIPRPDYTMADRRSASLGYVPHRFKVPSPKRAVESQGSFNIESPKNSLPTSKIAPSPLKKPQVHSRSALPMTEGVTAANISPITQQNQSNQPKTFYTRQASQNNSYNINKLY